MWKFFSFLKNKERSENTIPKLGILRQSNIKCCVCNQSLIDGDVIVTGYPEMAHASCVVLIEEKDGTITTLGKTHPLNLTISREDWELINIKNV